MIQTVSFVTRHMRLTGPQATVALALLRPGRLAKTGFTWRRKLKAEGFGFEQVRSPRFRRGSLAGIFLSISLSLALSLSQQEGCQSHYDTGPGANWHAKRTRLPRQPQTRSKVLFFLANRREDT